jgi:hypothetical protein
MSTLQTPTTAHRQPNLALILTAALIALAVAAAVVAITATGGDKADRTEFSLPSHVKTHGGAPVPERPAFRLPSHARIHGGAPVPDLSARRP